MQSKEQEQEEARAKAEQVEEKKAARKAAKNTKADEASAEASKNPRCRARGQAGTRPSPARSDRAVLVEIHSCLWSLRGWAGAWHQASVAGNMASVKVAS